MPGEATKAQTVRNKAFAPHDMTWLRALDMHAAPNLDARLWQLSNGCNIQCKKLRRDVNRGSQAAHVYDALDRSLKHYGTTTTGAHTEH